MEGINPMSLVFGTHEDTDIGIRLIIYMMQTREEKGFPSLI